MPMDFYQGADSIHNINQGDLGDDPQFVRHLVNAGNKLQSFSKAWDVGSQAAVFYPYKLAIDRNDNTKHIWVPCISALYGHQVGDWKLMGRGFVVSRSAMTANAEVIGEGDMAYQFSRLAPILINAMRESELAECAKKDWNMLGQSAYQQARQQIEDKYDRKNNMNAVKPLLGRLAIQMNTVVLVVALNPQTSTPIWDTSSDSKSKTGLFVQPLSPARREKLDALANNPLTGIQAQHPNETYNVGDVAFLEVLYNFTSSRMSKSEAGRADPQGVAESVSLLRRFPDDKARLENLLGQVPTTSADIRAKLYKMEPMTDEELRQKFQQYTMNTMNTWGYLSPEDQERLIGCANIIDYLRVKPTDQGLVSALEARLGHEIGRAPIGEAPKIDNLVGSDSAFNVEMQSAAVDQAVAATEQNPHAQTNQSADLFAGAAEDIEV